MPFDKFLICLGTLTALASGVLFPFVFLQYGTLAAVFMEFEVARRYNLTNSGPHNSIISIN
jgi:hypothetical protein